MKLNHEDFDAVRLEVRLQPQAGWAEPGREVAPDSYRAARMLAERVSAFLQADASRDPYKVRLARSFAAVLIDQLRQLEGLAPRDDT